MINNKGFTLVELLAFIIILAMIGLIWFAVMSEKPYVNQDIKMEWCMDEYEDFEYCKYKLGVDHE